MSFPAATLVKPAREWAVGWKKRGVFGGRLAVGNVRTHRRGASSGNSQDWIGYCCPKRFSRKLEPERSIEQIHLSVRPGDGGSTQMRIIL